MKTNTILWHLIIFFILLPFFVSAPPFYILATDLVKYEGEIEHLFTHCLVAYPELAFQEKNFMKTDYDRDCLTVNEFNKILQSLYEKNYILVKMSEIYEVKNGQGVKKTLYLPKGKKPLIFSFDDVNYDTKKLGHGMVDKIILDEKGNLATYTKNAKYGAQISYDNECVTILENFIKKYPDFSFNNAKGLLCLTGYDGILGYRTDKSSKNREEEIIKARKVVKTLKENGWELACHSYGHYHMSSISDELFLKEITRWQEEVETLIGKTNIYVYPYGEYEIADKLKNKTYKHTLLEKAGFKIFCGVGQKYFFGYAPFHTPKKDRVLFMDRHPIDGNNLRMCHKEYEKFFDSYKVYDHKNRKVPFYNE